MVPGVKPRACWSSIAVPSGTVIMLGLAAVRLWCCRVRAAIRICPVTATTLAPWPSHIVIELAGSAPRVRAERRIRVAWLRGQFAGRTRADYPFRRCLSHTAIVEVLFTMGHLNHAVTSHNAAQVGNLGTYSASESRIPNSRSPRGDLVAPGLPQPTERFGLRGTERSLQRPAVPCQEPPGGRRSALPRASACLAFPPPPRSVSTAKTVFLATHCGYVRRRDIACENPAEQLGADFPVAYTTLQ
jgi:hypothetical protein